MKIIKLLSKYGVKVKPQNTALYSNVLANNINLKYVGLKFNKPKLFDLYCYSMISTGSKLFQKTLVIYSDFMNQNDDLVNHLSYEQKTKFLQVDIQSLIQDDVVQIDGNEVYIPYLSKEMNHMCIYDYLSTLRKPYIEDIRVTKNSIELMKQHHGIELFKSKICALDFLFTYDDLEYFYDVKIGYIFILDKNASLVTCYPIFDKSIVEYPTYDIVRDVLLIEDAKQLVDALLDNQMVNEKIHKKLSKKLKVNK